MGAAGESLPKRGTCGTQALQWQHKQKKLESNRETLQRKGMMPVMWVCNLPSAPAAHTPLPRRLATAAIYNCSKAAGLPSPLCGSGRFVPNKVHSGGPWHLLGLGTLDGRGRGSQMDLVFVFFRKDRWNGTG